MRRNRRRASTDGAPDLRTLARVAPDLWPRDRADLRLRVVVSLVLMVVAKLATIVTPFFYRAAVDGLAPDATQAALLTPVMLVVAYGFARLMGTVFQQLRDVIFARR
jgi:ATP-binding cassette subfamily B protein